MHEGVGVAVGTPYADVLSLGARDEEFIRLLEMNGLTLLAAAVARCLRDAAASSARSEG